MKPINNKQELSGYLNYYGAFSIPPKGIEKRVFFNDNPIGSTLEIYEKIEEYPVIVNLEASYTEEVYEYYIQAYKPSDFGLITKEKAIEEYKHSYSHDKVVKYINDLKFHTNDKGEKFIRIEDVRPLFEKVAMCAVDAYKGSPDFKNLVGCFELFKTK